MPASTAANLTNIPGANITGTIAAVSGANLTSLTATNLGSGTVPPARLGSGTASSTTVLYGAQTYKAEPGGDLTPSYFAYPNGNDAISDGRFPPLIESPHATIEFSLVNAAVVYCKIMNPEFKPVFLTRSFGTFSFPLRSS